MPHKNNLHDLSSLSIVIVLFFGFWGAYLNYIRRILTNKNLTKTQKIIYFSIDFTSSTGFAVLTYIALQGWGVNELLSVAAAGFVSHQGTRAVYLGQIIFAEKLGLDKTVDIIKEEHDKEKKNESI